jgi:hypothetical protein
LSAVVGTLAVTAGVALWGAAAPANAAGHAVSVSAVVDGSAPFSAADGPGQDSSAANGRVRAGDTVTVTVRIVPGGVDDVVLEASAAPGLLEWSDNQPAGCSVQAAGVRCAFGLRAPGVAFDVPLAARAAARTSPGDASGQVTVSAGGAPATTTLVVTAAPPAIDALATAPRVVGPSTLGGVDGVLVVYGVHLLAPAATALVAADSATTWQFVVDAASVAPGAEVVSCVANGAPGADAAFSAAVSEQRLTADVDPLARVASGGQWGCAPTGATALVAVTGADTNPSHPPSVAWDRTSVSAGVLGAGAVTVFVPTAALPSTATLAVGPVFGSDAGRANHGTCADASSVASGACPSGSTRSDALTATAAGAPLARLTVVHAAAPGVAVAGTPLTLDAYVTNTGNVALDNVAISGGVTGSLAGALAPGQTWHVGGAAQQPATGLASTVTANATAADPAIAGQPVVGTHTLSVALPAASTVAAPTAAATPELVAEAAPSGAANDKIALRVYVNGIEFESLPGPLAVVGKANLVEYEVENLTALALNNVVIDDSSITDDATTLDCGEDATTKNRIPNLAANDTAICVRTFQPPTATNTTFTVSATVAGVADARLAAGMQIKQAVLDLELLVNGLDADTPPGPSVVANSLLTLTYRLTNSGQIDLANVFVGHEDDEDGTFDEIACAPINDDTDGDAAIDLLKAGQVVTCALTPRAVQGAFTSEANAVGTLVSPDGQDLVNEDGVIEVSDVDRMNYTGVAGSGGGTSGGGTTSGGTTTGGTTEGTIGQGGANTLTIVVVAAAVFTAGAALWVLAHRRRHPARV